MRLDDFASSPRWSERAPVVRFALALGLLLALTTAAAAQDECLDPSRTLIPGGPGNAGCRTFNNDAANCNAAYIIGGNGPTSCYLQVDGDCEGCGPNNEGPDCTNVCQPAPFCSDSRPLFIGGSGNRACRQLDDDPAQCNLAYQRERDGRFASCFPSQLCDACGDDESGYCLNSCVPPPTCVDQTRPNFVGGPDTSACQQFDSNQAACEQAFHLGADGVAPCYYDADDERCRGCGLRNESDGDCTNTCIAQPTCLDQSRTTYAGGPGTDACRQFDNDQGACEAAFHRGGNGRPAPCFYDEDDECRGCGPSNEGAGVCINTCTTPVPCLDQARTIYAGPPGSEGCIRFSGDQAMCEQAYVEGADGVTSCFYDVGNDRCRVCVPALEDDDVCTNSCVATPTCLDQTRTIYGGGPGSEGCRQFDEDPTQCLQAFTRGQGGVASCFLEADGDCLGCGPANVNDGKCVNSCKTQPICGSDPDRTVLGCGQFDGNPTACAAAYGLLDDGSPTSCAVVDVCLGCGPSNRESGACTNACAAVAGPAPAPALSWMGLLAAALALGALSYRRLHRRA